MAHEDNAGLAYLQALKQSSGACSGEIANSTEDVPISSEAKDSSDGARAFAGADKRRSRRYKCEGSAEILEDGCEAGTRAKFVDISMHGCYLETAATYPVGTTLTLKLAANGFQVRAKGTVRVNYLYSGMGIAFTEMSPDDRTRLRDLVHTVSRPLVVMGPGIVSSLSPASLESIPLISDPSAALQALIRFFEDGQALSRDEFLRILCSSQTGDPTPKM